MLQRLLHSVLSCLSAIFAATLGLGFALVIAGFAGENPLRVLQILYQGAFGTPYSIGMTLSYATPLIFTGLAVALPFHAGLFNIGAEGQLLMGALGATLAGIYLPFIPFPLAPLVACLCAASLGALWGAIPGWIRAYRGGHEVISTIMLNFIASALTSYVILDLIRGEQRQGPESLPVAPSFLLKPWSQFEGAPVGWPLGIALLIAVLAYVFLRRSAFGFATVAVGESEATAELSAIDSAKVRVGIFALAGAVAGLVGVSEVLGGSGKFKLGFSADLGFTGIAVALLARCHPIGVIPAALLFGALHKGSTELDLETEHITRDLALVMQASIIGFVTIEGLWRSFGHKYFFRAKLGKASPINAVKAEP